jgi:hypothetical protein
LQTATQPQLAVWNLSDYSSDQISAISNLSINNQETYFKNSIQTRSINDWNQINMDEQGRANEFKRILGDDWNAKVDYETDLYRRYQAERVNAPVANRTILDVPEFNVEFPIADPYTIPSDKKPYSIDIRTDSLEVTYKYYAVPKLDKDAFLLAQIVGWEELNLVGGPVNIYQGRKYIGQSKLDIRNLGDTLSVSFGRDKDVVVTRVKVKGKTNNQLLGGTKKSSVAYNISVANHHATPIYIEVQDQVPISSDKEVLVTIDEMGGGILEDKIGVLTWGLSLQPSGNQRPSNLAFRSNIPSTKPSKLNTRSLGKWSKSIISERFEWKATQMNRLGNCDCEASTNGSGTGLRGIGVGFYSDFSC